MNNGKSDPYGKADFWETMIKTMPREPNPENFKNWKTTRRLQIYHIYRNTEHPFPLYANEVVNYVNEKDPEQGKKWKAVLKEPKRGHNDQSYDQATLFLNGPEWESVMTSSWTLKSAHHILSYESMSQKSILDFDQIVEIGAGIGEVSRIIHDLGFKGSYHILDLPLVYRISSYYLANYPNVCFHDHYSTIPNDRKTLFIGTWSFSEVHPDYRDEIIAHFKTNANYFILYQQAVFGYDNADYFRNSFPEKTQCKCSYKNLDQVSTYVLGEQQS